MILTVYFILTCQVCCSSSSTASWRYLEDDLLLDINLLFPSGSIWQAVPGHSKIPNNTHNIFQVTFQILQNAFLNEISSQCCKVRLPPDAFRKQLTSCCSTPSNYSANRLHFFKLEKVKKIGGEKASIFHDQFMIFPADAFRKQLTSCSSALHNAKLHTPYLSRYLSTPPKHYFGMK